MKEIHSKFTVEIMKLVFVFIFSRKVFGKFFQIMFVVGAISIDTLVNGKMLAILYRRQRMITIWTQKAQRRSRVIAIDESLTTDFALILTFTTVIVIYEVVWSIAKRA